MVIARIDLSVSSDNRKELLRLLGADAEHALRVPGCRTFQLLQSTDSDSEFMLYEEWERMEDFDAYRNSEQFKAAGPGIFGLLQGKPAVAYYSAEAIEA